MKKILLMILIFTVCQNLSANDYIDEFGKITKEELSIKKCSFDTLAEAVVISDYGESFFVESNGNFEIIFERTTSIKIVSEAGLKWANIEIPFYESGNVFEKVYEIEAITFNYENGLLSKSEFNDNNSHIEKLNENWKLKKFAIPNVKVGSIIKYRYKISSDYVFNLRDWEFQWEIPVLKSKYVVKMIPFYQYSFLLQGANKFDEQKSEESTGTEKRYGSIVYKDLIHTYAMKNIKSFKDEEFITSKNDYIIKMDFQLSRVIFPGGYKKDILTTWPLLVKDLNEEDKFGKYVLKCQKLTPKIFDLKAFATMTSRQKFDSVINYVKRNFNWNKYERIYASKSPKNLMADKIGNSADINLFTIGLLNGVGVKSYPLILSTRENGKIKTDYPFFDFFDYVLIKSEIDSISYLSDATDLYLSNFRIPANCLNDKGLVIQKNKVEWIELQTLAPTKSMTSIITNRVNDEFVSKVMVKASEYDGLNLRKNYGTDIKAIEKHLTDENYTVKDSSISIKNMENASSPFIMHYAVETKAEIINDKLYFSPFLNELPTENPFKQNTRTYPVDMIYAKHRTFVSNFAIPKGYKVNFVPQDKKITTEQFELDYKVTVFEESVTVAMMYYFKSPVYKASDYLKLKFYYNELISKGSEKIVFEKD